MGIVDMGTVTAKERVGFCLCRQVMGAVLVVAGSCASRVIASTIGATFFIMCARSALAHGSIRCGGGLAILWRCSSR